MISRVLFSIASLALITCSFASRAAESPASHAELITLFEGARTPLPMELGFGPTGGAPMIGESWGCQTYPIGAAGDILATSTAIVRFTRFLGFVDSEQKAWGTVLVGKNILAYSPGGLRNLSGNAIFELRITGSGDLVTRLTFSRPQAAPFVEVFQFCDGSKRLPVL